MPLIPIRRTKMIASIIETRSDDVKRYIKHLRELVDLKREELLIPYKSMMEQAGLPIIDLTMLTMSQLLDLLSKMNNGEIKRKGNIRGIND